MLYKNNFDARSLANNNERKALYCISFTFSPFNCSFIYILKCKMHQNLARFMQRFIYLLKNYGRKCSGRLSYTL